MEVPRGLQNFIVFGHRFLLDFGSILASNMGPSWGPRRLKIRKNGLHKFLGRSPKTVLDTSLLLERVPDPLGIDFGGVRARFSEVFG